MFSNNDAVDSTAAKVEKILYPIMYVPFGTAAATISQTQFVVGDIYLYRVILKNLTYRRMNNQDFRSIMMTCLLYTSDAADE